MRLKMMEPCESGARPIEELAFLLLPAPKVDNDLLQQCANLYSNHYGIWGPNAGASSCSISDFGSFSPIGFPVVK